MKTKTKAPFAPRKVWKVWKVWTTEDGNIAFANRKECLHWTAQAIPATLTYGHTPAKKKARRG